MTKIETKNRKRKKLSTEEPIKFIFFLNHLRQFEIITQSTAFNIGSHATHVLRITKASFPIYKILVYYV